MQQRAPRVVGAEVVSSTAHRDVGGPGVDPRRRKIVDSVGSAGTTKVRALTRVAVARELAPPTPRPDTCPRIAALAPQELEVGTSKHSSNPPGYGGFVPSVRSPCPCRASRSQRAGSPTRAMRQDARNERAIEHGRAERTRDSLRKVHIQATYRHNPPGYTGHVPTAPHNVITQRQVRAAPCGVAGAPAPHVSLASPCVCAAGVYGDHVRGGVRGRAADVGRAEGWQPVGATSTSPVPYCGGLPPPHAFTAARRLRTLAAA